MVTGTAGTGMTPEQQLHLARQQLQRNQLAQAQDSLRVLANQNYAPALFDLANVLLIAGGDALLDAEIPVLLQRAEALGYAPAAYQSAVIGFALNADPGAPDITQRMQQALRARHPEALCDAAMRLAEEPAPEHQMLACLLLEHAALQGNPVAMALLGERLMYGQGCPANPARANAIRRLARAHRLPVPEPESAHGFADPQPGPLPGLPADWDFLSWALPSQEPDCRPLEARANIQCASTFLSAEQCLYIQCLGGPHLRPSVSVDPNGQSHQNRIRTSHDFWFLPPSETLTLKRLQARMARAAGLPLSHAEYLVLLRYQPGQEYRPHRDSLPPSHYTPVAQGGAGQRVRTAIAYLNTPEAGGGTQFPLLQREVPARAGQLLRFDSIQPDGRPETDSLHAGAPVKQGLKWICTLWLRERPYRGIRH